MAAADRTCRGVGGSEEEEDAEGGLGSGAADGVGDGDDRGHHHV